MSKPFIALICIFIGFVFGLLTTATLIDYEVKRINRPIDSAIILELPKDEADLAEQLLYLSASKGMLEEIQRQRMVQHEAPNPRINPVRIQSRAHKK
jgi:hypothetical protein